MDTSVTVCSLLVLLLFHTELKVMFTKIPCLAAVRSVKASCSKIQVLGNEVCFVFTVNSVTAHKHQQLHKSRNTLETTRTVFICNVLKHHLLSASILYSYWQSDMPSRLLLLHYGVWKWAAEPPWDQLEVACGFVVGLFLGLFLALALAFIQTEN